jgi:hypothetical protein
MHLCRPRPKPVAHATQAATKPIDATEIKTEIKTRNGNQDHGGKRDGAGRKRTGTALTSTERSRRSRAARNDAPERPQQFITADILANSICPHGECDTASEQIERLQTTLTAMLIRFGAPLIRVQP